MPWYGSGAATFILRQTNDSQLPNGFVQARKRLGRAEAEACYIAPALDVDPNASHTWRALLEHLVAHAGDFGIQRLYACLPAQGEASSLLAQCGFAPYVRETLFRLRAWPETYATPLASFVRPQRESDSLALQRLADRFTPPVVLKSEGAYFKNHETSHTLIFQNWWQPGHQEGLVFERAGIVEAALIWSRGKRGAWLRYLGNPMDRDIVEALLREGLTSIRANGLPIYCSVRSYQSALGASLHALGFEDLTELTRFVKHTTVSIQEPATNKTRLLIETTFPGVISTDMTPPDQPS